MLGLQFTFFECANAKHKPNMCNCYLSIENENSGYSLRGDEKYELDKLYGYLPIIL